jgi:glucans biosynthesis protein C
MHANERQHSLDNLRGVMMWLGVVLHVADLHLTSDWPLPWHDSQTSLLANLVVFSIHAFRMPAFFLVAGYFVSLLFERRGLAGMLANRLRRVGLPLLIFWPLLFAAYVLMATYSSKPPGEEAGPLLNLAAMPVMRDGSHWQLMHLWFLQILLGLALASALILLPYSSLSERARAEINRHFTRFLSKWWAPVALAIPLAVVTRPYRFGIMAASAELVPPPNDWLYHGLFFAVGLGLYFSRMELMQLFMRHCWRYFAAGLCVFCLELLLLVYQQVNSGAKHVDSLVSALLFNACSWMLCLALLGIFCRYIGARNALLDFSARSSYWVYLVHLPVLIAVHLVMRDWSASALTKMALNIAVTSAICALSYQYFVRYSWIGVLLNGSRESRPRRPAVNAELS